jgi:DNA-binding NarL/FixJ family response regulator
MTGIDGLLAENQIESALVSTVRAVRSGLICLPQRRPHGTQAKSLSSREKQVLGMLIMGFTNAEIGRRLYLAESTVKSHLSSAYTKLGVRSRKDAAELILDPNGGLGTGILAISGA